jgi:hypothetical protein
LCESYYKEISSLTPNHLLKSINNQSINLLHNYSIAIPRYLYEGGDKYSSLSSTSLQMIGQSNYYPYQILFDYLQNFPI